MPVSSLFSVLHPPPTTQIDENFPNDMRTSPWTVCLTNTQLGTLQFLEYIFNVEYLYEAGK